MLGKLIATLTFVMLALAATAWSGEITLGKPTAEKRFHPQTGEVSSILVHVQVFDSDVFEIIPAETNLDGVAIKPEGKMLMPVLMVSVDTPPGASAMERRAKVVSKVRDAIRRYQESLAAKAPAKIDAAQVLSAGDLVP